MVRDWLSKLPDKQRIVIMRRFGLDNDDPVTLETLADEMGLPVSVCVKFNRKLW